MAAILEPVCPETDEPCADALEPVAETPVVEDAIPLESMTWPELKRVARQYDLKLNVKKPVLIRQIRDARAAAVEVEVHRQSFYGRCEAKWNAARAWIESALSRFAEWWRSDQANKGDTKTSSPERVGMSQSAKIVVCVGGILVGGVAAVIAALI